MAGRLHPDRQSGASSAEQHLAERRMKEVNESWQVLRDPARRRAYDDERLAAGRADRPSSPGSSRSAAPGRMPSAAGTNDLAALDDEDLVDVMPPMTGLTAGLFRHLPWVVLLVVFGLIFVVTAYATADRGDAPVARVAGVGDCVDVRSGPSVTVVPCDAPHQYRIESRVGSVSECPAGTESRRLGTDGLFDCLARGPSPS